MNKCKVKSFAIIGAGGHASVLADILLRQNSNIVAVVTTDKPANNGIFSNVPVYDDDSFVDTFSKDDVFLINGIGQLPYSRLRENIYNRYISLGYQFASVISDYSIISPYAVIADSVQIFPGSIVQAGSLINENSIINSGSIIEHDSVIGKHNHVSPGSVICGGVKTGDSVCIGAGTTIIQSVTIGNGCIIGAGCVITKDIESGYICYPSRVHIAKVPYSRS